MRFPLEWGIAACVAAAISSCLAQTPAPVARYANLLGGTGDETVTAVATDGAGNLYLAGTTTSSDFPQTKNFSSVSSGTPSIFVAKVDATGGRLLYSVLLGSQGSPAALIVDSSGSAYVAGFNADVPTTPGAISSTGNCFLSKLNPAGTDLTYSTRLTCGPNTTFYGQSLAVDGAGAAYLTGSGDGIDTTPGAYRMTPGEFQTTGFAAFAMKVNPQGTALVYSTYLAPAQSRAIAVDAAGNAYITGQANQRNFTVTVSPLTAESSSNGNSTTDDVFVLELNSDGSQLLFSTLFGGDGTDFGTAIAVDQRGAVYIAGTSHYSSGYGDVLPFPTTPNAIVKEPGFPRGFLTKLAPLAKSAVFSTLLPDLPAVDCMSVGDRGVDVVNVNSYNRLLRVSADGSSLLGSSLVGLGASVCGSQGGFFALGATTSTLNHSLAVNSDLAGIGQQGKADGWFSMVQADAPEAPRFDIDRSQFSLYSWAAADGSLPSVLETIHATVEGGTVPLTVISPDYITVTPNRGTAPADLAVSFGAGFYTDRIILFAAGARNGVQIVPVSMNNSNILISAPSIDWNIFNRSVSLGVTGPEAPPVAVTLQVSSSAVGTLFFGSVPVPTKFSIQQPYGDAPWLKIKASSDTTPAVLQLTADPAGLKAGAHYATVQLTGPDVPRGWPGGPSTYSFSVLFQVGAAAVATPSVVSSPGGVSLRLTSDAPTVAATIHLESTGAPVAFLAQPSDSWLHVEPATGTTPMDIQITAAPNPLRNGRFFGNIQFVYASDNSPAGSVL